MTTSRDPDRLIQAFLEEGPSVLTDRVHDAIRDDVERTDQWAGFGPWRNLIMSRPLIAAAVAVVAIVGGLAIYTLLRAPSTGIGSPDQTPVAFPAAGDLSVGTTYILTEFGEPMRMTIPASMGSGQVVGGFTDGRNFRVDARDYGVATVHDDVLVPDDLCNPAAAVDVPATPEGIGDWLTGAAGLTVSAPRELSVDGRTALAWDISLGADCIEGSDSPVSGVAFWFQRGEHHRIYAIPTGDDTILALTWGGGYAGEGEEFLDEMNAATDDLVRSMDFE